MVVPHQHMPPNYIYTYVYIYTFIYIYMCFFFIICRVPTGWPKGGAPRWPNGVAHVEPRAPPGPKGGAQ